MNQPSCDTVRKCALQNTWGIDKFGLDSPAIRVKKLKTTRYWERIKTYAAIET